MNLQRQESEGVKRLSLQIKDNPVYYIND